MESIDEWVDEVHTGHVIDKLREMPESSVHCVVTSPPYYGLRDYGEGNETLWGGDKDCEHEWFTQIKDSQGGVSTEENPPDVGGNKSTQETRLRGGDGINSEKCIKCGGWVGQLGLEPSLNQFVENLVSVGNEIQRVLRDDGSWWLNLGDTYSGGGGIAGVPDDWDSTSTKNREKYPDEPPAKNTTLPAKCKMMVPHRVAIALVDSGFLLRNDSIWRKKGGGMPESVTDRLSTTFEYFFHFVQQGEYYYDLDSIREPYANKTKRMVNEDCKGGKQSTDESPNSHYINDPQYKRGDFIHEKGKNPGDVFIENTASFPEAHFATYPTSLIEKPVKATCPEKVCSDCGTPYNRENIVEEREVRGGFSRIPEEEWTDNLSSQYKRDGLTQPTKRNLTDWEQQCDCDTEETEPGLVLDPFIGAGTTAVVAQDLGRKWIGIDLNKEYVDMAQDRAKRNPGPLQHSNAMDW